MITFWQNFHSNSNLCQICTRNKMGAVSSVSDTEWRAHLSNCSLFSSEGLAMHKLPSMLFIFMINSLINRKERLRVGERLATVYSTTKPKGPCKNHVITNSPPPPLSEKSRCDHVKGPTPCLTKILLGHSTKLGEPLLSLASFL